MDKTSYVLTYPSRPLVDTRVMNMLKLNNIPSGFFGPMGLVFHQDSKYTIRGNYPTIFPKSYTQIYVWICRSKFWTLEVHRAQKGGIGWQNPFAKWLLKVCEAFFEGPMLCKLVRAKLAGPALPAKFKCSSVCVCVPHSSMSLPLSPLFSVLHAWIALLLPFPACVWLEWSFSYNCL